MNLDMALFSPNPRAIIDAPKGRRREVERLRDDGGENWLPPPMFHHLLIQSEPPRSSRFHPDKLLFRICQDGFWIRDRDMLEVSEVGKCSRNPSL